jgi:hypothetical protein
MDTHADNATNGPHTQWAAGARTNAYEPVNTSEPFETYVAVSTYEPANAYEPEGGHEIPPPPQAIYPTAEATEAAIHAWTKTHGYNVSRQNREFREGVLVEQPCSNYSFSEKVRKLFSY